MNNLIQRFEKGHYTVAHKSENYTTVPKGEKLYEKRFTKVPTFDPIQEELRDFIRVLDRSDFESEGCSISRRNGDGFINHEEFVAHMARQLGKSTEKERYDDNTCANHWDWPSEGEKTSQCNETIFGSTFEKQLSSLSFHLQRGRAEKRFRSFGL